ncbi:MAG: DUF421 domain-containing protein [Oscillospiraceae bacterium]
MLVGLIRSVILYIAVIACIRIMGKRQIGELQPSELVITILISEVAAMPMQDTGIPLINSFIPLLVLVSLEIITSAISIKSGKFRNIMQGNSLIIIRNGILDQKQIKNLRLSVEDILEALRKKDVFNIDDVLYAIAETDGSISIMLKPEKQTVTAEMLKIKKEDHGIHTRIIDDGKMLNNQFKECQMSIEKLNNLLEINHLKLEEVLLMTADLSGDINIIERDKDL